MKKGKYRKCNKLKQASFVTVEVGEMGRGRGADET